MIAGQHQFLRAFPLRAALKPMGKSDARCQSLVDLIKYAYVHKCNYIRLDPDGKTVRVLKTYDW